MCHFPVQYRTLILAVVVTVCVSFNVNTIPTARIIVHVSKRRAEFWEPWEVNRRICPPSLCRSSDPSGGDYRPRGTAGTVFYQGDIILNKDEEQYIFGEGKRRRKRATMRLRKRLWKNGEVPYVIDPRISDKSRKSVVKAMRHIEEKTCIRFRKRENKDKDYVRYISEPGCWSNVGKKGGAQLISLGRGCEHLGTAVHETTHALGVWHEQARADRDKYVSIEEENISPKYLPDFSIINRKLSTSRGYPYDYRSIMHYNKYAFTRAGDVTIKVIGIGKKLNMKIGQRQGLSTIDMAQLRDMYRCNQKEDSNAAFCPKGWVKHVTSCYKFYDHPKKQFSAAFKMCEEEGAFLVNIENRKEEKFLEKYIKRKFKFIYAWRMGAKRINNTMVWYKGEKKKHKKITYTNWDRGQPSTYTSATLTIDRNTKRVKWHGVWAGSTFQLPSFMYSFICEKRAKRKCIRGRHKDGRDYRGKLDHTVDGITCQTWSSQYPHQHKLKPANDEGEDLDGLGDHNYCRNPRGLRRKHPWCYVTKRNRKWQYCDISICSKPKTRQKPSKGRLEPRYKVVQKPKKSGRSGNMRKRKNRREKIKSGSKRKSKSRNGARRNTKSETSKGQSNRGSRRRN